MAKILLTKDTVKKATLPDGKSEAYVYDRDVRGFTLRLRRDRPSAFYFIATLHSGAQIKKKLGDATAMDPAQARQIARQDRAAVDRGDDPTAQKKEARAAAKARAAATTFGALVDPYVEFQRQKLRASSVTDLPRNLRVYAKPLHSYPVDEITRRMISDLTTEVAQERGRIAARKLRSMLSSCFAFAIAKGWCENNPVINSIDWPRNAPRSRVLTTAELSEI